MAAKVMVPDAVSQRKHVCMHQNRAGPGLEPCGTPQLTGSRMLKKNKPGSDKQDL